MKKILLSSFALALVLVLQGQITLTNDINPGTADGDPSGFQELNGKLYFNTGDGVNGRELWSYNPSDNTSQMVFNIGPGATSGLSSNFSYNDYYSYVLNGKLYFSANDQSNGAELWVYDGSNSPSMVADIIPGATGSGPRNFIDLNNKLYFTAKSSTVGQELFVYDPVTQIAQSVSDINPGIGDATPGRKIVFGNKIYFSANHPAVGTELYVYDPTSNVTTLVSDIYAGNGSSYPESFLATNDKLYFKAGTMDFGYELYSYSGLGTPTRITDIAPNTGTGVSNASALILFNGKIYLSGTNGTNGYELYALDVATNTVQLIYDIDPGAGSSYPTAFCIYSGKLFFCAGTTSFGNELWSYDGTNAPAMVEDFNIGVPGSLPLLLKVMGNRLYFNAQNGTSGYELFYYQDPYFSVKEYNSKVGTVAYPVPSFDEMHIRVSLEETSSFMIHVYDINGKVVYTVPTTDYVMGTNDINIPMQSLAKGIYPYAVIGHKGVMGTGKIIKQ